MADFGRSAKTSNRLILVGRRLSKMVESTKMFGAWTSVVDVGALSGGVCKQLCELRVGAAPFWIEQSLTTGKRSIFRWNQASKGNMIEKLTDENVFNVKNSVHEYGGGSIALGDNCLFFTANNEIYRQPIDSNGNSPAKCVTNTGKDVHYADIEYSQGKIYCVMEDVTESLSDAKNSLVAICVETGKIDIIADKADFFASPRISPNGEHLAWMQWDHPNMPWDVTAICMTDLNHGSANTIPRQLLGDGRSNFCYPKWSPNGDLFVISDRTNWWNLYRVDIEQKKLTDHFLPQDTEIGGPHWQFGDSYYAFTGNGNEILLALNGSLHLLSAKDGKLVRDYGSAGGFTRFRSLNVDTANDIAYCIAMAPDKPESLLRINLKKTDEIAVIRQVRDLSTLSELDISIPENLSFDSDGTENRQYDGQLNTAGKKPPVILFMHGGPTSEAWNCFDMKKQYFTSRGFAIFDVNYRGSTGRGRQFRDMLYGQWGIVDRDDLINGAKYLIDQNRVDPTGICIWGGSAGGFLLLSALVRSEIFSAAVCLYGIGDLKALVDNPGPKFECRYTDRLIGSTDEETLRQRSPINSVDKINCPTIFLHGTEDPVVDCQQSVRMHEALKKRGIETELALLEGEGHGFRGSEAITKSIELPYQFICRALKIE